MIIIDGLTYNVPVVSIDRKADFLDKQAGRTENGALQREMIGTYINYQVVFGSTFEVTEYAALWNKITEPIEFHTVTIPDGAGQHTFEAYFANVSDKMRRYKAEQAFYKELTVSIISRYPTKPRA